MNKEDVQEVFDLIKNTPCTRGVYTTYDLGVMQSTKEQLLTAIKEKWPQEAATLSVSVPSVNARLSTF